MINDTKYVVITPVRNEEKHIEKAITSMIAQTVRPQRWVIVDDGSSDHTADIISRYLAKESWMKLIIREDRGERKQGGGVIEAFYDGCSLLKDTIWEYIVKLDGDISISPDYFEKAFQKFEKDPELGVGGGLIHNTDGQSIWPESTTDPEFHVRGATKIYRKKCWQDIGELIKAPGWDTLDEVKANMKGWRTYTFNDLPIIHHRPTGQVDGTWKNWVKNGLANYISGYHPLFMTLKCIKRLWQHPYIIGSAGLMWGYLSGYLMKVPRIQDQTLVNYLRKQQIQRITFRQSIWK